MMVCEERHGLMIVGRLGGSVQISLFCTYGSGGFSCDGGLCWQWLRLTVSADKKS